MTARITLSLLFCAFRMHKQISSWRVMPILDVCSIMLELALMPQLHCNRSGTQMCCCDLSASVGTGQQVVHLIVSRTATGSSCRFVAAFTVAFLKLTQSSLRHRAASGLLGEMDGNSISSNWGSRGSFPTTSLPSSPLGSPRRWGGLGPRRNVSSFGSLDSSAGQDDDNLSVER